ncbi:MAG: dihydrofolate reductase [Pelagibacteraceae bacterium]|nr:dihydrofolate reductase [Pelagibacteraceae bacterium]
MVYFFIYFLGYGLIRAILAIDDKGGVGKAGSMPWPSNKKDFQWFKRNTEGNVIIMGSSTWKDPKMKNPLPGRVNIVISSKEQQAYPGADMCINGILSKQLDLISKQYPEKIIWIIGGPNIVNQLFSLIEEVYLTRIYGNFNCDTFLDIDTIRHKMKMINKINGDETCHFEIWAK